MKAVLGGGLETGLIRQMMLEFNPTRLETNHTYYRSLQRRLDANAFSRAATVLSISETVLLPPLDWNERMLGDQVPPLEQFGWNFSSSWKEDKEWNSFAEKAFDNGAFNGETLERLKSDPPFSDEKNARFLATQYLNRLFLQLNTASNEGALLFLPPEDQAILEQLSIFARSSMHQPPFDLPDLDAVNYNSEEKSITLLAFQPPDTLSIIPVRKDRAVRKYAEKVMELWKLPDPVERERNALKAMQDVIKSDEVRGWAANVFEVSSWTLKALGWFGVPGVGAIGDARDVANIAREKEKESRNWLLIRTKMNDISLHDYLHRTGNL